MPGRCHSLDAGGAAVRAWPIMLLLDVPAIVARGRVPRLTRPGGVPRFTSR